MSNVILMYIYFIGVQPPPLGLRVVVTDVIEAPQYMIDAGEEVCKRHGYGRLAYIYHNPDEGHSDYKCKYKFPKIKE